MQLDSAPAVDFDRVQETAGVEAGCVDEHVELVLHAALGQYALRRNLLDGVRQQLHVVALE